MNNDKKTIKKTQKRQLQGVVLNAKDKTISVEVTSIKTHTKYKKNYKSSKKYQVHDERNIAKVGDKVVFEECRPMSKMKRWRISKIVK
ncbi:MAG: 30S ribosomal protein S17 [Candidatus Magasanikbacteria bacterium]|nr:30S ribosomal protein S17 [Candidatus Magasanikbacteria bacterium]